MTRASTRNRRDPATARRAFTLIATLLLAVVVLAGCELHKVALVQRCPVAARHGAPAIPRLGIATNTLKDCFKH
jgi:hypothetical protein